MIKVGITGMMGSGKTYISGLFADMGVPVYNSDLRVRTVQDNNFQLREELIKEFGDVYNTDGLDRPKLREIVFLDTDESRSRLQRLNQIVFPYVIEDIGKFYEENAGAKFVLLESAILFETGLNRLVDKIVFVHTPEHIRVSRSQKRDKITIEEYRNRMKSQIDPQVKKKLSDYTIWNITNSSKKSVVKKIFNELSL